MTGTTATDGLGELHGPARLAGELVSVGDDSNVDFYALGQRRLTRRAARSVTSCAFDVLWLDGIDCTRLPYRDRRRVLEMPDAVVECHGWRRSRLPCGCN